MNNFHLSEIMGQHVTPHGLNKTKSTSISYLRNQTNFNESTVTWEWTHRKTDEEQWRRSNISSFLIIGIATKILDCRWIFRVRWIFLDCRESPKSDFFSPIDDVITKTEHPCHHTLAQTFVLMLQSSEYFKVKKLIFKTSNLH